MKRRSYTGSGNPNYKDGRISKLREWKLKVFVRDNYTCRKCGAIKPKRLSAHHIKRKEEFPQLMYVVRNGITLCPSCHMIKHKRGKSNPLLGRKHSAEWKRKIAENHVGFTGRKHTVESRRKMSMSRAGELHPMFGKHHTEEANRKNSEAHLGKRHSEESKRLMSLRKKGVKKSEETKQRMREAWVIRRMVNRKRKLNRRTFL